MKFLFGLIITIFIIFSGSLFAQEKIQLAVVLATNGEPDKPPPRLSGFYIYINNGKEIKKEFQTDGGYAWNFYGEYFTKEFKGPDHLKLKSRDQPTRFRHKNSIIRDEKAAHETRLPEPYPTSHSCWEKGDRFIF